MGVELPRSGSFTRQRTFSVGLQRSGRFDSLETPTPAGPRQFGQFSAAAGIALTASESTTKERTAVCIGMEEKALG